MTKLSIAIDGPAGAGKSTVAKRVAQRLNVLYIDTGAMYRAVAWLADSHGLEANEEDQIIQMLHRDPLVFQRSEAKGMEILWRGELVPNEALRTLEVSNMVSAISAHPGVREILTDWQRKLSDTTDVVMDGRDIGTVVLPQAQVKIFLTASLSERARRRAQEMDEKGYRLSEEELRIMIGERDERDSSRDIAPLRQAEDAHCIDSTGKNVEQVVDEIISIVERVGHV